MVLAPENPNFSNLVQGEHPKIQLKLMIDISDFND